MGLLHLDGTVLEVNHSSLAFIGKTDDDVAGQLFWETPWWKHSKEEQKRIRNAVKSASRGRLSRFESSNIDKKGRIHAIDFSVKPFYDNEENIIYLIAEGRDISELKKTEESLKQREDKLGSILFMFTG